jgi:PHD finger protein 20
MTAHNVFFLRTVIVNFDFISFSRYSARITGIDDKDRTVLIHFDGWNQRYDEWIKMDSERLRPITRHSERKDRKEKSKASFTKAVRLFCLQSPIVFVLFYDIYSQDHKLGDHVFAKWTDCRMYPALIIGLNSNG